MKKFIIASLLTVFLFAGFQSPAVANHISFNELVFHFVKFKCEFKLRRCYINNAAGRELVEDIIIAIQSIPPQQVEGQCRAVCDSESVDLRKTRRCSDEQCENRCEITSGILDNGIMNLIANRNFRELRGICNNGLPD